MNGKLKKTITFILPIALGIFFLWLSFRHFTRDDYDKILQSLLDADYRWVLLSVLMGIISHLSRAYRWLFLLRPLGYRPRYLNSVMSVFAAYLVNISFPRAGELLRAATLNKYEDIPYDKALGTIITERIVDLFMLGLVVLTGLFFSFDTIWDKLMSKTGKLSLSSVVWLGASALLSLIVLFYFVKKSKHPFVIRIRSFLQGMSEGIISILHMKKRRAFILHTLFIWAMYLGMFYVMAFAFPETGHLPLEAALSGFIIGAFSMAATNGGLGSYPYGVQQVFILYGIASKPALTFGIMMWASQTLMIIVLGELSFVALPWYNAKNNAK